MRKLKYHLLDVFTNRAFGGNQLGCYLVRHKVVPGAATAKIVSEQGLEMGRPSFINIEIDQKAGEISGVRISGQCFYMGEGYLEIDTSAWQ